MVAQVMWTHISLPRTEIVRLKVTMRQKGYYAVKSNVAYTYNYMLHGTIVCTGAEYRALSRSPRICVVI